MISDRYALIVDIVRSRDLLDRAAAQRDIEDTFARAARYVPLEVPLWATVGDEFQAVAARLADALWTAGVVRLLLPEGLDVRIGIGRGEIRDVAPGARGVPIQDGSAWWAARTAIDEAHERADGDAPYTRTWYVASEPEPETDALLTSQLVLRDRMIDAMTSTQRAYAGESALGQTQAEIAAAHGVTQPAVSQSLRRSGGAAVATSLRLLQEVAR
ncbi:SatD family protein [Flavimobilis soli]|uniref:SatD family protein n=1 Tax=Flavimobilis soli TaxID=442709 RepID=A0A2A9E992_9MICO|nr:SatD family protein [Flavimobilis soli]